MGLRLAVKIVDHIANEIKNNIFTKIIEQNRKVCVIINEASSTSDEPVFIIFLKSEDCDYLPTIFLDLVELDGQKAEEIHKSLLKSLHDAGFNSKYWRKKLIAFCLDRASVVIGRDSRVGTKDFSNIVIWHCLNHCLQLAMDDSVNDIKQVNLKYFWIKSAPFFISQTKTQGNSTIFQKNIDLNF